MKTDRPKHLACNLHVELKAVDALRPLARNARTHTKRQIRQIADSIAAFGFTNPVLVDAQNTIIAGHGRVEAARLLGMPEVPTLLLDRLTEAEKHAYVLADNKLAELAGWDRELLTIELQYVADLDLNLDLTLTGFSVPELDMFLSAKVQDSDDETLEDVASFVKANEPAVTQPGDLWLLGEHRLLCGDARDPLAYERLMDAERAQMILTDPPYNVRIQGNVSGLGSVQHREFAMGSGEMSEAQYTSFLRSVLRNLTEFSVDGSLHFIFQDWRHMDELANATSGLYAELKNLIVWAKSNAGMGSLYRSQHELIFLYKRGTAPHINNIELGRHGRHRTNVWIYAGMNSFKRGRSQELQMHPTCKPVPLLRDALLDCSERRGVVLDCFAGSGSLLVAADRTGRRARAMEIDPTYVDAAIRRWQTRCGGIARRDIDGRTFDEIRAGHKEIQKGVLS